MDRSTEKAEQKALLQAGDAVPPVRGNGESIYESGEYLKLNPSFHVEDSAWKAEKIHRLIEKNGLDPRRIADIGCGAGEVLFELHRLMPHDVLFHGYDISPQGIELARARQTERLQFFQTDMLEAEHEIYDLVLCIDVFEHVPDYLGFLRQLRSHARHQIFHIPLDLSVQTVFRDSLTWHRKQFGHLHYFSPGTALATLRDCGYEIIDYSFTAGPRGR